MGPMALLYLQRKSCYRFLSPLKMQNLNDTKREGKIYLSTIFTHVRDVEKFYTYSVLLANILKVIFISMQWLRHLVASLLLQRPRFASG
jgi:hypothetical protein